MKYRHIPPPQRLALFEIAFTNLKEYKRIGNKKGQPLRLTFYEMVVERGAELTTTTILSNRQSLFNSVRSIAEP